jgi:hypothetical protein
MENDVFWDIKTVLTSQETHYVSAVTEECRLLGYKHPVRTSQETTSVLQSPAG